MDHEWVQYTYVYTYVDIFPIETNLSSHVYQEGKQIQQW